MNLVVARALTSGSGGSSRFDDQETLVVGALNADKPKGGWRAGPDEAAANQLVTHTLTAPDPNAAKKDGRRQDGSRRDRIPIVTHILSSDGANAGEDGRGRGAPIVTISAWQMRNSQGSNQFGVKTDGLVDCLDSAGAPGVALPQTVRRLTPTECARLQGFPDGWCCLCQPLTAWADDPEAVAEGCICPDSPQYRAYGNAVTVNVVEWIGARMLAVMSARPSRARPASRPNADSEAR